MAKTQFSVDLGKALANLIQQDVYLMQQAEVGVAKAMLQLKTDTVMQRPTAPIKEGFLRGAISIFVQNKPIDHPALVGERTDKRLQSYSIAIKKTQIVGVIGVNVPYAARWHEVPAKFSEPSAGNKYLESKMINNRETYKRIVGNTIKQAKKVKP